LPLLTYLGPSYSVTLDGPTPRIRGVAHEVSDEWLNKWRVRLASENWRIEGDEQAPTIEGVPDAGWKRADILAWLSTNGVVPSGYTTKGRALELVGNYLSEGQNDEQVQVEESPVEEHPQGDDE